KDVMASQEPRCTTCCTGDPETSAGGRVPAPTDGILLDPATALSGDPLAAFVASLTAEQRRRLVTLPTRDGPRSPTARALVQPGRPPSGASLGPADRGIGRRPGVGGPGCSTARRRGAGGAARRSRRTSGRRSARSLALR